MLNAPRNDQTIRIATLCAYFPGVSRADIMRFVGVDHATAIIEPMDYLLRTGYLRRSSRGGFNADLSNWSPSEDMRADTVQCQKDGHDRVDEEPPIRNVG